MLTQQRRVTVPLTALEASAIIRDLSVWRVHNPTVEDVLAAIALQTQFQHSFWDAIIMPSANAIGCVLLSTEKVNDGQRINNNSQPVQRADLTFLSNSA